MRADGAVVVLVSIQHGIDGVNPIYHETIKVCDSLYLFSRTSDLTSMDMKVLYTLPQSVGIVGGCPSSSYYLVGSQAENLFYLDPHHTHTQCLYHLSCTNPPHPHSRPQSSWKPNRSSTAKSRKRKEPRAHVHADVPFPSSVA